MRREDAIAKLREARVGRLATIRPDGGPHVVPFVFAIVAAADDLKAYWAVDAKPKRRERIRRLENIEANEAVEFVVDGYDEDWGRLWWVRVGGRARVVRSPEERTTALGALAGKYRQYGASPPAGVVVAIDVDRVTGWSADERSPPDGSDSSP